ncbi:MAG: hypothetical protein AB7V18_12840 [Pyrinomonadaceae bacterium]
MRLALVPILALIFGLLAFGCETPPAKNGNAQTGVGSATGASTPRQDVANAATPTPGPKADETAAGTEGFEGTAGITDKENPKIKGSAVMSYVRTATHNGYDRVVFEFLGGELPNYHVEYVDKPVRACGSGDVVPFSGEAWLQVRFSPSQAHSPDGDATIPVKDRARSPNFPVVKDLKLTCDFEGEVEWVMGVSSPNHYRIIELKDPTRVAIDIKHK